MKIIESLLTKNRCYQKGEKIAVKGLMLHSIGCPQPSAKALVQSWNSASAGTCVHAFIDGNSGEIYQTLPWNHRAWHCGSGNKGSGNNFYIAVEMCEPACIKYTSGANFTCSNLVEARAVAERTYKAAVELFAMLCQKYNLNPLANGVILSHREGHSQGIASNHGDPEHLWTQLSMGYTMDGFRKAVKAAMDGNIVSVNLQNLQAKELNGLSEAQVIGKVGPLFTADQQKTGILASVSLAQFILESGYGKSELAQNANNCFGMKCRLSGNTWGGTVWDGISIYTKKTQEYENGAYVMVTAEFRNYPSVDKSIADHSAYLLGAKNGNRLRYEGLKGCTDYRKAVQIIKGGGYATAPDYVDKLCSIIEKWNLTRFDVLENFSAPVIPYQVRVKIDDLNIRTGPGINYGATGQFTGKGTFTIMEEKQGPVSSSGKMGWWGLLKSYQSGRDGWISLDYTEQI